PGALARLQFSVDFNCGAQRCDDGALCLIGKHLGENGLSQLWEDASAIYNGDPGHSANSM
ncbi:hypothetical protein STEG23_033684, partial [Scotinomys teguina]